MAAARARTFALRCYATHTMHVIYGRIPYSCYCHGMDNGEFIIVKMYDMLYYLIAIKKTHSIAFSPLDVLPIPPHKMYSFNAFNSVWAVHIMILEMLPTLQI